MNLSRAFFAGNRTIPGVAHGFLLAAFALAGCSGGGGPTAIEIPIARIQVTQPCTAVIEGETCRIGVRAFTADDQQIGNPVLRYLSTNESVAPVSDAGVVSGRSVGQATIVISNSTSTVFAQFQANVFPRGSPK